MFIKMDKILKDYQSGLITSKEGVSRLAEIIHANYGAFDLFNEDDDLKSIILLDFLEKGHFVLEKYNPEYGSFYNYVRSFIRGYIRDEKKSFACRKLTEEIYCQNTINDFSEMEEKYSQIYSSLADTPKIPYKNTPLKPEYVSENLKKFMAKKQYNSQAKIALIIALKNCFYLTDEMVKKLSKMTGINEIEIWDTIQYLKETIPERKIRHNQLAERRNAAFFKFHRTETRMQMESHKPTEDQVKLVIQRNKQHKSWEMNVNKLSKGVYRLCPTNRSLAQVLGLCERQISYYITHAKRQAEIMLHEKNTEQQKEK